MNFAWPTKLRGDLTPRLEVAAGEGQEISLQIRSLAAAKKKKNQTRLSPVNIAAEQGACSQVGLWACITPGGGQKQGNIMGGQAQ